MKCGICGHIFHTPQDVCECAKSGLSPEWLNPPTRPVLPPALLEALKQYIDHSTAAAMGAAFDYEKLWSAVEAANREEVR